jgi:short-subunit dehydrogenase
MPTVLIVGATGNIGISAVIAARKLDYKVLAVVRNKESAEKLFAHVGSSSGITTVEADILSDKGVAGVVEKVRQGALPAFQHVYAAGMFSSVQSTAETSMSVADQFADWIVYFSGWPLRHDFYT